MAVPVFNVLGVAVSALNLDSAKAELFSALRAKRKGYVVFNGVHGVSEAQDSPRLRNVVNRAFLNTPDGMPLVWLGRKLAGPHVGRVYGPDVLEMMMEATRDGAFTHFFYGGRPGVADALKARMEARFPGVRIVGTYCPPFRSLTPDEDSALIADIARLRPDMVWVGIGTPKQDFFMADYLSKLDTTLMFGVGAAFDFLSGRVRQAPKWMQRSGLEWLFRLTQDPWRLARRYLINNPLFLIRITLQLSGIRTYPLNRPEVSGSEV
jgi:N-acetylglucosaminyldiphosphoundecaprenol N-acetyl-beta-D-mannosaminyltransferase